MSEQFGHICGGEWSPERCPTCRYIEVRIAKCANAGLKPAQATERIGEELQRGEHLIQVYSVPSISFTERSIRQLIEWEAELGRKR